MREQLVGKYLGALNCAYTMLGYTNEFFADIDTLTELKNISSITIRSIIGEYKDLSSVNVHEMTPKLKDFCEKVSGEHVIHSYKKDFKIYFEVLIRE